MCHWTLRIWQCGESYFTKCSPCSFDRAAHAPDSLLNPLHPCITPFGVSPPAQPSAVVSIATEKKPESSPQLADSSVYPVRNNRPDLKRNVCRSSGKKKSKDRPKIGTTQTKTGDTIETANSNNPTRPGEASSDVAASNIHVGSEALQTHAYPYRASAASPLPLPVVVNNGGTPAQPRATELWDGMSWNCGVFEVVLTRREMTICPACARSPKRARLPAYARGIYG